MNKPLYVFATLLEALLPIEAFQATLIKPNFYESAKGDFLISGIGSVQSATALSSHLSKHPYSNVINIGFAGSLKDAFKYGTFYEIEFVEKHLIGLNMAFPKLNFHLNNHFPKATLVTSDVPIHDEIIRTELSHSFDLVDMEGWGIAWVCTQTQTPCTSIKIVSDFCTKTTSAEIRTQAKELSKLIAQHLF